MGGEAGLTPSCLIIFSIASSNLLNLSLSPTVNTAASSSSPPSPIVVSVADGPTVPTTGGPFSSPPPPPGLWASLACSTLSMTLMAVAAGRVLAMIR